MYKKLILGILGLGLIFVIGYLVVYKIENRGTDLPIQHVPYSTKKLGEPAMLKVGEEVQFADDSGNNLSVTLKEINDSRCAKDVVCIWQGEISSLIDVSGGRIVSPAELRLGTENFKIQHMDGYTFALQDATLSSITLLVTYQKPPTTSGGCFVGGCSGQLCSDDQDVRSTCEYKKEYACYQSATCERQSSGKCGWTQTTSLKACLSGNL